jgi:AcrR family transcriptional regulator
MPRVDIRSIRRRQILEAAERVATQKGWTETTIADICQAADVSTGVVTRHFENKDEIMLAALEDILEQFQAQQRSSLGSGKSLSENIQSLLPALSQTVAAQPSLSLFLLHAFATSIARPEIAERLHVFFSQLRQQHMMDLKLQFDEKGIPDEDRVLLIDLTYNMAFGLTLSRIALGTDLSLEPLALHSSNMLLKYFDLLQAIKD